MARRGFQRSKAIAELMRIARHGLKERDRIEAIKVLALFGYSQTIFVGAAPAQGALPPGAEDVPEEAVQFYLPSNEREERKEESA
jgi:hypothetical protein